MLETVDLDAKLSKAEFKKAREPMDLRLGELQRKIRAANIPVIVVFEGWEAAGVGTAIGRILNALDPRGYKLHTVGQPTEEAAMRPPLWRFWISLPPRGAISVYDGSWYHGLLDADRAERKAAYDRTRAFERELTDDQAVMVKFWLHISKDEQAKRFRKMAKDPALSWRVTKQDWRNNRQYEKRCRVVEEMLTETSTANAPWTLVPSHDHRYATMHAAETLAAAMEQALGASRAKGVARPATVRKQARNVIGPLDAVDLTLSLDRKTYERDLPRLQKKLLELENLIYIHRIPVVIVYEGWDASGKGGNIKRLVSGLDHRGFEVIPIGPPEGDDKTHHYLWRFWRHLQKAGHITLFDRSWYGRVLVERVERFATPEEWQRAYREINEFEKELTDFGTVLVKFWIHISKEEQLKRFKLREEIEYKRWKITPDDWRNRRKWDAYYEAVSDMLAMTSTATAPWTVVEGNQKLYARVKALKTVIEGITSALKRVQNGKTKKKRGAGPKKA